MFSASGLIPSFLASWQTIFSFWVIYSPPYKLEGNFFLRLILVVTIIPSLFFSFLEVYSLLPSTDGPFLMHFLIMCLYVLLPLCAFYYHFRGIIIEKKKAHMFKLPLFTDGSETEKLIRFVPVSRTWTSLWKLDMGEW